MMEFLVFLANLFTIALACAAGAMVAIMIAAVRFLFKKR